MILVATRIADLSMKLSRLSFCHFKAKRCSFSQNTKNRASFDTPVQQPAAPSTSFSTSNDYPITVNECCNRCLKQIKSELEGVADPMRQVAIRKDAFALYKQEQFHFFSEADWQFVMRFVSSEII